MPKVSRVKELLKYNPKTGDFIWIKPSKYHAEKKGKKAGCIRKYPNKKYRWIGIDGRYYSCQRLAWLYMTGKFPFGIIDHRNGDSLDNRFENLNCVDRFYNAQNHKIKIKKNGLPTGIRKTKEGKYQARIRVHNKKIHLGTFTSPFEAFEAYRTAREKLHYCPSTRRREND